MTESPESYTHAKGDRLGPYRVEERLGVGGMGEVYKAWDDRLERWVAIKRIRPDREEAEDNRERFQREARATAKLNHASIVHLYDIFSDGDSDCIVMEYVEGKSLDVVLRGGPLDPLKVATLGHEIAAGLAEAHDKKILHRDLKVENIILTPAGQAKILDFGLAKPLLPTELDTSLTGKGQLVGTSRAMSPEYVSGESIDHRSDLFSLGVLLYEAATGHSPFKAHNTLATLKQVMLHRQTPAAQVSPTVPPELSDLIESLLEKDPDDRPQSTEMVSQELGRISGQLSSGTVDRPSQSSTQRSAPSGFPPATATAVDLLSRSRWLVILVVLALTLGSAYFIARWLGGGNRETETEPAPSVGDTKPVGAEERNRIVFGGFDNRTGEELFDDSIGLAFRVGLEQSRHAYVLPPAQIRSALTRMERDVNTAIDRELGVEICQREGARALVLGSILKIGESYSLSAEVIDPQNGITAFSESASAANQDFVLAALEEVLQAIRGNLGESLSAIEASSRPLEKVTTGNLAALKAYSLGDTELAAREVEPAIRLFNRAIELDKEFSMAHAKLAVIYSDLKPSRTRALSHLDQALENTDRLSEIEKLYVDGWDARWRNRPDQVIEVWSLMSSLYPDRFEGHINAGVARMLYRFEFEAANRDFSQAVRVATPEMRPIALSYLGYTQLALGQPEEALRSFQGMPSSPRDLASALLVLRRYPEAQEVLLRQLEDSSPLAQISGRYSLLDYSIDQGDFSQAQMVAEEIRKLAEEHGRQPERLRSCLATLVSLDQTLDANRHLRDALTTCTELALNLLSQEFPQLDKLPTSMIALVGKISARNSMVEQARLLHLHLQPRATEAGIPVGLGFTKMLEAEILLAQERYEEALELLKEALSLASFLQGHESLAKTYQAMGDFDKSKAEYQWLLNNRGRSLAECGDGCTAANLVAGALALYHLASLYELGGDQATALEHYRRFLGQWPDAQKSPAWQKVRTRLDGELEAGENRSLGG